MPRDDESLIDIERATRRVLRYASTIDRAALETNDEKVSASSTNQPFRSAQAHLNSEEVSSIQIPKLPVSFQ